MLKHPTKEEALEMWEKSIKRIKRTLKRRNLLYGTRIRLEEDLEMLESDYEMMKG